MLQSLHSTCKVVVPDQSHSLSGYRYSESAAAINLILEDWVDHREESRTSYVDCSHLYIIQNDPVCHPAQVSVTSADVAVTMSGS